MSHEIDPDMYWPDGTFKTKRNAFTLPVFTDKSNDIKREQANAGRAAGATRTQERYASGGKSLAMRGILSKPRFMPEIRGAARSQAANDNNAAIRKGSLGSPSIGKAVK